MTETHPAAYTGGEPFQRERRTVFAASWLPFAASGQMPQPGDFVSHGFGGWPLFAIRGGDGVARAFHNLCRHQDMPVVEQMTGHSDPLRCRYHGWTYGLDGGFVAAPPRVPPPLPPAQCGLIAATLAECDGLCLVRVRPGAGAPPRLALPQAAFAAALATDIDANWKAVVEAVLPDPEWRFLWPLAFVRDGGPGAAIVRQIVPRSFSRTRIVDLCFGAAPAPEAARRAADAVKTAAEACQARRAAAAAPVQSPALAEFLAALAAACAEPAA